VTSGSNSTFYVLVHNPSVVFQGALKPLYKTKINTSRKEQLGIERVKTTQLTGMTPGSNSCYAGPKQDAQVVFDEDIGTTLAKAGELDNDPL
jgi:hypothetical protein